MSALDFTKTLQPIEIINAESIDLLAFLDAAIALPGYKRLSLFAKDYGAGVAERVCRLWASSNNLPVREYATSGGMRFLEVDLTTKAAEARFVVNGCITLHLPEVTP